MTVWISATLCWCRYLL